MILSLEQDVLERAGFRVLTAENGAAALQIAGNRDLTIDVVVTDVVMPRIGGVAIYEQLSSERPDTRFLFTSGYAEDMGAVPPGVEFLAKPFAMPDLCDRVARLAKA